jgi:hypothetical protein
MNTILGIVLIIYFTLKIVKTFKFINLANSNIKSNLAECTIHVVNKKGSVLDVTYDKDTETFNIELNNE